MKTLFDSSIRSFWVLLLAVTVGISLTTSIAKSQNTVSAFVLIDTSNHELPLRLQLELNQRKDIHAVRLTAHSPTKFAAFQTADTGGSYSIIPIGETILELSAVPDTNTLPTGANVSLIHFLTDSTIQRQSFTVEFMNANGESLASQDISITIPVKTLQTFPQPCTQNYIGLNTGLNPVNGTEYPYGAADGYWSVTAGPAGSVLGPARVFSPPYFTDPSTTAQWIGTAPWTSGYQYAGVGDYTYRRCFCASAATSAKLFMKIQSDNQSIIKLNGVVVASCPGFGPWTTISVPVSVQAGQNCLEVIVHNESGPTSFTVDNSYIQTPVAVLGLVSDGCCSANGRICGRKVWDLNCNGKADPGEPGLGGWTIKLTKPGGQIVTAVTNSSGVYCFSDLLPGIYTVAEQNIGGWVQSISSGPYTVYLGPGQGVSRDFLNCKQPNCKDLFHDLGSYEDCCQQNISISNGSGAIQQIDYTVTGGKVSYIQTLPCPYTSIPTNLFGTTAGTLSFAPICNQTMNLNFGAMSTTATGIVCVRLKVVFRLGAGTFACDTTMCFQCKRMPKDCGDPLTVTPQPLLGQVNTDWRTFKITDVKLPVSQISSVDIKFINEPALHHIGGLLYADGTNRNWTVANSGISGDPYTQVRMNCSGSTNPHGAAANNYVQFNLGVDNTLNYSGTVHIKIGYCDGDTCEYDYVWNPRRPTTIPGSLTGNLGPANPHIFGLIISPPDSTSSVSVTLQDTAAVITAVTAPCGSPDDDCNKVPSDMTVATRGNSAQYRASLSDWTTRKDKINTTVVFTPGSGSPGQATVLVRYFDSDGREIGSDTKAVPVSKLSDVPESRANGSSPIGLLSIEPNPTANEASISYFLGTSAQVTLELYDATGNKLIRWDEGRRDIGTYTVRKNVSAFPPGAYIVRLNAGGQTSVMKLTIVR